MAYINTTVYKDTFDLYPNGCDRAVSVSSQVILREKVTLYDIPQACNETPQPYKWLLKINEPTQGVLWIDETQASFDAKVADSYCCTVDPDNVAIQFTIGDGQPGTPLNGATVYVNPALDGKAIKVSKNGVGYWTEGDDYDLYAGGGIELLGGAVFSTGETYLIWIL